ncbi:hypothetical protein OP10G_4107 [Fimbriimonas ginsengisoli Gsoil 348]|uniref:Uncharacterized protein n=2 Tax=Fimbriimonas ginsengisoli TaxID=1005039 RepID=A0A068NXI3_FIMGI|nr:hypothetical protein OP10G_4107 [Fimbriimonas ginsengisoli Gsoil 348]
MDNMPEYASRRDLLKLGLVSAAAVAIPVTAMGQVPTSDDIEKELGHPLPDEAKKLLKAAVEANRTNATDRLKTKLPDCSEPCFVYRPTGGKK